MWLIPGKTKVQTEIFKGVSIADILIGIVAGVIFVFLLLSNLPYKFVFSIVLLFITVLLLIRIDEEPNYIFLLHMLRHIGYPRHFIKGYSDKYLVTGHLVTRAIRQNKRPYFIYKGNNHIAIDCGSNCGGQLGMICLNTGEEFYIR